MKGISKFLALAGALFFGFAAFAAMRLAVAETAFRVGYAGSGSEGDCHTGLDSIGGFRAEAGGTRFYPGSRCFRKSGCNQCAVERRLDLTRNDARRIAMAIQATQSECLLMAARVDHQFLPAWTLANFYFRRGNREGFWKWADRAAALTYDDFLPLIRLCDRLEPDPAQMLGHLGDVHRLQPPYLGFLIDDHRLDAAQVVARGMMKDRANDPYLINLADRQLGAGKMDAAIELWNAASKFSPIEPAAGRVLTNGDLARAPLNLGFDWQLGNAGGGPFKVGSPSRNSFSLFRDRRRRTCVLLEQNDLPCSRTLPIAIRLCDAGCAIGGNSLVAWQHRRAGDRAERTVEGGACIQRSAHPEL